MIVICVDVSSCDGSEETTMMMKMNKARIFLFSGSREISAQT